MSMESSQSKKIRKRTRQGWRWESAQKRKKKMEWGSIMGGGSAACMCALSSWNSSTGEGIAPYSPSVKAVDAHLREVWFGSLHLADWDIPCQSTQAMACSTRSLNLLSPHTKHNWGGINIHTLPRKKKDNSGSDNLNVVNKIESNLLIHLNVLK